jgi:hypothetical protein
MVLGYVAFQHQEGAAEPVWLGDLRVVLVLESGSGGELFRKEGLTGRVKDET